jgi:prephenate dehydrogenase
MWTAICRQNRAAILAELERLSDELDRLRKTLDQTDSADGSAIHGWLAEAKRIKEQS